MTSTATIREPAPSDAAATWGRPTPTQWSVIRSIVRDHTVVDLGAGLALPLTSRLLADSEARHVSALDKAFVDIKPPSSPATVAQAARFKVLPYAFSTFVREFPANRFDVGLLSWPENSRLHGLVELLERCEHVALLCKTTDGSSCGFKALYEYLLERTLVASVPDKTNSLIVVGALRSRPRKPTPEEWAGLHWHAAGSFEQACAAVEETRR